MWDVQVRVQFLWNPFIVVIILKPTQSKLPKGGKPLGYIRFVDKGKLSSFGTHKGYPVIARLANLDHETRHGVGPGGGRIVGLMPIVRSCLMLFTRTPH